MAHGKNQHFVSQFYLKNFACGQSRHLVRTLHIPRGRYVAQAEIKHHACDDYFYGKDGAEAELSKFEGAVKPIIARIIASEWLPEWQSQEHKDLVLFAIRN